MGRMCVRVGGQLVHCKTRTFSCVGAFEAVDVLVQHVEITDHYHRLVAPAHPVGRANSNISAMRPSCYPFLE